MDCHRCQTLLESEWDGDLADATTARELQEHLRECPTCRCFSHKMNAVLVAAHQLRDLSYDRPIALAPLVLGRPRVWSGLMRPLMAGVAVGLTLMLGFWWGRGSDRQHEHQQPVLALEPGHIGAATGARVASGSAESAAPVLVRIAVPMPNAKSVALLGDFPNWERKMPLVRTESGLWVGELRVAAGRYQYVIVVDGESLQPDPAARQVVDDGFGGKNSVLDVGSTI